MALVRQSIRTRPPFGETGDPPLPNDSKVLFEEEYHRVPNEQRISKPKKHDNTSDQKDMKRILKTSSRKDLTYADHVERLMIEESAKKQLRRRSWVSSSSNSSHRDDSPLNHTNDRLLEKILEKFEDIRSGKTHQSKKSTSDDFIDNTNCGVERIVERRYYVKKMPPRPNRDQRTSTSDLRLVGKKTRLSSGVSSITATSSASSRYSSSVPSYIENLREQSNSLRHDFVELKNEIEQLLVSQQDFFQQLQTQIPPKTENTQTIGNKTLSSITGQRSRSVSTESQSSDASSTSGTSTPVPQNTAKPVPTAPPLHLSEFIADKNPSYTPAPPVTPYVPSKPNSFQSNSPANPSLQSKSSSVVPNSPINAPVTSKPPIAVRTPSTNLSQSSKPPSIAPTPPINPSVGATSSRPPINNFNLPRKLSIESVLSSSAGSQRSSVAPTPPKVSSPIPLKAPSSPPPQKVPSPTSSPRMPIYENELAHRRVLSPYSQIVASSASGLESSASSTRSNSSLSIQSVSHSIAKVPTVTLGDNELKDLVRYSSQLELSGFRPSITPVITNPNTSSTFWESVDHYIENSNPTNRVTDIPSMHRSYYGRLVDMNGNTTKQLDKYDLEIRPQDPMTSSAPLLMPPLDISS
ncbi:hypothetical protein I4U23_019472 [Adineta vaga]|nr:hypothetical protein I4U23_019472 [Adineta vaga]